MPSQLGYWAIRGLAQSIRFLLSYAGEDFEDVLYEAGDGPEFSKEAWFSVKNTLGLDFPNDHYLDSMMEYQRYLCDCDTTETKLLPYYIDGDTKLTQSNTILRHLARKYKLYGDTEEEHDHVDLLLDQITDLRNAFAVICYKSDFDDKVRDAYIEQTKSRLEDFEKYLGDKQFFIGDKVAACDFYIYEMLYQHRIFEPNLLTERPKLTAYIERFEELPSIKAYMNSERFISRPINNKHAHFV